MATTQLEHPRPKAPGLLTLNQISRQSGVGVRPLVYLVDRAGIAPARRRGMNVYSFEDIHELLAGPDLPQGAVNVAALRAAFRATRVCRRCSQRVPGAGEHTC
jgi:hypothetical protein